MAQNPDNLAGWWYRTARFRIADLCGDTEPKRPRIVQRRSSGSVHPSPGLAHRTRPTLRPLAKSEGFCARGNNLTQVQRGSVPNGRHGSDEATAPPAIICFSTMRPGTEPQRPCKAVIQNRPHPATRSPEWHRTHRFSRHVARITGFCTSPSSTSAQNPLIVTAIRKEHRVLCVPEGDDAGPVGFCTSQRSVAALARSSYLRSYVS